MIFKARLVGELAVGTATRARPVLLHSKTARPEIEIHRPQAAGSPGCTLSRGPPGFVELRCARRQLCAVIEVHRSQAAACSPGCTLSRGPPEFVELRCARRQLCAVIEVHRSQAAAGSPGCTLSRGPRLEAQSSDWRSLE